LILAALWTIFQMDLNQQLDKCPRFSTLLQSRHVTGHNILAIFKDQDVIGLEPSEPSVTDAATKRAP
jgi:hypothetical protein